VRRGRFFGTCASVHFASPTEAEQTAELADAARRLEKLRERRARLANVPAPPEDPGPFVARQIPRFG
jgi:hypothetical protein